MNYTNPNQNPHLNFVSQTADVGQRHMNMIAELEQQKQNIIHNTTLYVQRANQACAFIDQVIEQHKQALSMLTHTMHGTAAPVPQQAPQQVPQAPQQQRPAPQVRPVAQAPQAPATTPAPAPTEHVAEVIHSPPPNGAKQ